MPKVKVSTPFNGVNDGEVYPRVYGVGEHSMGKDLAALAVKEGWGEIVEGTAAGAPPVKAPSAATGKAGGTEGDDTKPVNPYTQDELEKLSHKELIEVAKSLDIPNPQQTKKVDLVQNILALSPAPAAEGDDTPPAAGSEE